MNDLIWAASVALGMRVNAMEPSQGRGLSKRSQFLLWLLQHQPEVIEVVIEYEADEDGEELLDLTEDQELAEALLKDLLATDNDAELEANRDFLETCINKPPTEQADGQPADGN